MSRARLCHKDALGAMILLYIVVMIIDAEMVSHLKSSGGLIARQDKDLFKVFTRPLLQKGSRLQEEILSVCVSVDLFVRHHFFLLRIFNDLMV